MMREFVAEGVFFVFLGLCFLDCVSWIVVRV